MARRYDPERRQRIIDAALRVVGRSGIAGLSHRTVAAEADVPLGSTTYHFASLDELLIAALRQTNADFASTVRKSLTTPGPGTAPGPGTDSRPDVPEPDHGADSDPDLAATLARVLGHWLAGERTQVELEYELYLAALRRPGLRPVAEEWTRAVVESLAPATDPATARALVAMMDGICLGALLTDTPYDEGYAREMLTRVLRPAPGS